MINEIVFILTMFFMVISIVINRELCLMYSDKDRKILSKWNAIVLFGGITICGYFIKTFNIEILLLDKSDFESTNRLQFVFIMTFLVFLLIEIYAAIYWLFDTYLLMRNLNLEKTKNIFIYIIIIIIILVISFYIFINISKLFGLKTEMYLRVINR